MAKWNRNREGYADSTAGIAIQRVSREERKIDMAKKRNSRRTANENLTHEKAVKMRKMTDMQLVCYVENQVEKARSEGFSQGSLQASENLPMSAVDFVEEIAKIKGIGRLTMYKIRALLDKGLEEDGNV